MIGHGSAFGAVSILNATATGIGCALAVQGGATATWEPRSDGRVQLQDGPDDRLVQAVAAECADFVTGGNVIVHSRFPPARGLKTSSSVAAALVRAAAGSVDVTLEAAEVERRAVAASRRAAVTLTGAYDDQVATVRGGCHLTNNATGQILATSPVQPWHVAIWVPDTAIDKAALRRLPVAAAQAGARDAEGLLRAGDVPAAMTRNGATFHALYAAAGLPVTTKPVETALAAGAHGAGLSGTGPAVAALFDAVTALPPVQGGSWHWTRAVRA